MIAEQARRKWHRLLEHEMVSRNGLRGEEEFLIATAGWHPDSRYTKVAATFLPAVFGVS